MAEVVKVNAILRTDVLEYLEHYGVTPDEEGKVECNVCHAKVPLTNIGSIHFFNNKANLVCNKTKCTKCFEHVQFSTIEKV